MAKALRTIGVGIALIGLTACQVLPSVSTPFSERSDAPCRVFEPGPAPYVPPFPSDCATLILLDSGVRYIPIMQGNPLGAQPDAGAIITVQYEAFLADTGALVDSSYARGAAGTYDMSDLIQGWANAMQVMRPGDEGLVFVPSDLAFGAEGIEGAIPPNADLVYRMRLESFVPGPPEPVEVAKGPAPDAEAVAETIVEPLGPDMQAWQTYYPWTGDQDGVVTQSSGLSYIVLEEGPGALPIATEADTVWVHYEVRLAETSDLVDSSWVNGGPALFEVNTLVAGVTEALTLMSPGDRLLAHIPSELAYGEVGAGDRVPPDADLLYQLVLLEIQAPE